MDVKTVIVRIYYYIGFFVFAMVGLYSLVMIGEGKGFINGGVWFLAMMFGFIMSGTNLVGALTYKNPSKKSVTDGYIVVGGDDEQRDSS